MSDTVIEKLPDEELKAARPHLEELETMPRHPVRVVCENIRSLYNVGAIFRTADGALIEELHLCGYTGYPPRKEIDKTALGAVTSVPWSRHEDTTGLIVDLKKKGYHCVALEHTRHSLEYNSFHYSWPLCLVIGNEVEGVTPEVLALCDDAVEIPMYGLKQSLNVSVAFGILAYHVVENFRIKKAGGSKKNGVL